LGSQPQSRSVVVEAVELALDLAAGRQK